ncbi:hypothetical protein MTO96_044457 [Rhipicephalus appendiculatus]
MQPEGHHKRLGGKSKIGFIGRFLSWNAFVPLSKLSFGVYLIHMPFTQLMLHASRERVLWSKFNVITLWFAVLVWSFLLGLFAVPRVRSTRYKT